DELFDFQSTARDVVVPVAPGRVEQIAARTARTGRGVHHAARHLARLAIRRLAHAEPQVPVNLGAVHLAGAAAAELLEDHRRYFSHLRVGYQLDAAVRLVQEVGVRRFQAVGRVLGGRAEAEST